tara:strand:- start:1248 stop:2222 length:975 start_codon:yes stop_codon:yes gene_type:complete
MKKYRFTAVYITKDYYPMFDGCLYKYSKADYNDINVINVDMGSTKENLEIGEGICSKLGIRMAEEIAVSMEDGLRIADEYMTKNNIESDWMLCFQHDVFPMTETFWEDLQKIIDDIDEDKVGIIGGNSFSNYNNAIMGVKNKEYYGKTKTGRGMLSCDILSNPYDGWYKNLPDEYYKSKYFAVESPYWAQFIINRKLFREHVEPDSKIIFELWGDDLAYQFLSKGIVNISVPHLLVCHDHNLKNGIKINAQKLIEERHDFNSSQMRFWQKWGFRWGIRNLKVREQFSETCDSFYDDTALQPIFFNINIDDGPLDIDLKSKAPTL